MNSHFLYPVWVIAKNNFREIIRERLLYGILIMALLVTGSSFFLANISLDQSARVLQNIGLTSITLFSLFICVFVTTNSLHHDFERRTLYLLFSKPISRSQYLLGKYVGMLMLLLTNLVILGGIYILVTTLVDKGLIRGDLLSLGFSFLEVSLLIGFALLFATFTAPLNAALYTLALFIIGHSLTFMKTYVDQIHAPVLGGVVKAFYYLLPNLGKFDVHSTILYQVGLPLGSMYWTILYWLAYLALALWGAITILKTQEV